MDTVDKVNSMQEWLRKLEEIKKNRRSKKIDDVDAYNKINSIIESNDVHLTDLGLYDVFEYAKEYYLLRIQ